jgi:hypothetical protein
MGACIAAILLAAHATIEASGASRTRGPVRVSTLTLSRSVLASVPSHPHNTRARIAHVVTDGAHLVASTSAAAFWFDTAGRLVRQLAFPRRLGHLGIARLRQDGQPVFVGSTDSVGRKLILVPSDGSGPFPLSLAGYRAKFADLLDGGDYEAVASSGSELLIYNVRGELLRRVAASDYVWDFVVLNANDTPHDEILAYLYQNRRDGTFVELIDADGERIRAWHEPKANRYSVSTWSAPAPSVVAVLEDVITERSPKGVVLRRFTVPGLGSYRYAQTGVLRDGSRLALVRSGSCPARLLAFDEGGTLVYDEEFPAYAALLVPSHGAAEFFVGMGATIYRYRLGDGGSGAGER